MAHDTPDLKDDMRSFARRVGTAVVTLSSLCTAAHAAERGTLFIVGGGSQAPALVRQFMDLAGGPGRARIIIFAMASAQGKKSGEEKARELRGLGADARSVWVTHEQADSEPVARLLDEATAIWFGGGDQVRLMAVLRGTRTEAAIRARYESGAVVGGTSAGAAVMSAVMITGGERQTRDDHRDPADAFTTIARDQVITADGLGLVDDAIVDQHFVRRKRHNRLMSLVLDREPHLAVGIDEGTALIVDPEGRWSVAGASVAVIYDARASVMTPPGAPLLGATGITVHVLPAGSAFDPKTGFVQLAR